MRGRPSCLLQSAEGEANRILLASALSSMRIIDDNALVTIKIKESPYLKASNLSQYLRPYVIITVQAGPLATAVSSGQQLQLLVHIIYNKIYEFVLKIYKL